MDHLPADNVSTEDELREHNEKLLKIIKSLNIQVIGKTCHINQLKLDIESLAEANQQLVAKVNKSGVPDKTEVKSRPIQCCPRCGSPCSYDKAGNPRMCASCVDELRDDS